MRSLAFYGAVLAALALAGCSTPVGPSQAELKANWEAQNVAPQDYKRDLLAYMRNYFNNATRIRNAAVSPPQRRQAGPGERYVACVRYNERKSDGKYSGVKEGAATFVAGKLDRFFDTPSDVRELCKDAAYAPFPELNALAR